MKQADLDKLKRHLNTQALKAGKRVSSSRAENGLCSVEVWPAYDGRKVSTDERKRAMREVGSKESVIK